MQVRFANDRFQVGRLEDACLRQLDLRGLAKPTYDRHERAWVLDEGRGDVRTIRFLHEAYHVPLDEDATERLEQLTDLHGLRDKQQRMVDLDAAMRPYQHEGVEFILAHRRVLLADAMGLGKTLQALASLEHAGAYPAVVVAPASVKLGWQNEILKWLPWRSCQVAMKGRDKLDDVDIVILNPELLAPHLDELTFRRPKAVVFDESHYFKNPRAGRTKLAVDLADNVPMRIALTGTPIQNRREDLVQQLSLLGKLEDVLHIYRGVLPHWWSPSKGPLRWDHAMNALANLPRREVHQRLRDVCMIRRTKQDVAADLPSFSRLRREVPMADAGGYVQAETAFVGWVEKMRQATPEAIAAQRLTGRHHLSRMRREAAMAKTAAVVEWASQMRDEGERVLFFAYHKAVVKHLAKNLPGRVAVITGETHPHQRRVLIDTLNKHDFMVATMDSLGQGVDGLQHHANHVAFVELDWTPTKHDQCEGRLHRVGQRQPVTAWYFTAADSIEGAMMRVLDSKWEDVTGIVDGRPPDSFMATILDDLVGGRDDSTEP